MLTEGLAEYSAKLHTKGSLPALTWFLTQLYLPSCGSTISQMETIAQGVDSVVLNLRDASTGVKKTSAAIIAPQVYC